MSFKRVKTFPYCLSFISNLDVHNLWNYKYYRQFHESIRLRALNDLTTEATWLKNQDWEALSGINANLSLSFPALWVKRIPVSSTVTPCIWVNGNSQSRRSFFDQKESTREAVMRMTLSAPGESLSSYMRSMLSQIEGLAHWCVQHMPLAYMLRCSDLSSTIDPGLPEVNRAKQICQLWQNWYK